LDVALTADDYQVTVDDLPCPVVLLTRTVLTCHIVAGTYIGVHRSAVKVLCLNFLKKSLTQSMVEYLCSLFLLILASSLTSKLFSYCEK